LIADDPALVCHSKFKLLVVASMACCKLETEYIVKDKLMAISTNLEALRQEILNSNLDPATADVLLNRITFYSEIFTTFDVTGMGDLEAFNLVKIASGVQLDIYNNLQGSGSITTDDQAKAIASMMLQDMVILDSLKQLPSDVAKTFRQTNPFHQLWTDNSIGYEAMPPADQDAIIAILKELLNQYAQDAAQLVASFQTTTAPITSTASTTTTVAGQCPDCPSTGLGSIDFIMEVLFGGGPPSGSCPVGKKEEIASMWPFPSRCCCRSIN